MERFLHVYIINIEITIKITERKILSTSNMIIENGYQTAQSYHCLIGCIENYMNYYKLPICGTDLFFLGNGFEYQYPKNENSFSLYSTNNFLEKLSFFGIICTKITLDNHSIPAKEQLIKFVLDELPIILQINTQKIHYDRIFSNSHSVFHSVNLIGYDIQKDSFCISDSFIPAFDPKSKQIWINVAEILDMLEPQKEILMLQFTKTPPNIPRYTLYQICKQISSYLYTSSDSKINYGKYAIRKYIFDIKEMLFQDFSVSIVTEMNYQLRVNGFFMGREFLCDFLKNNNYYSLADELLKVIHLWKSSCLFLTKYVISKEQKKVTEMLDSINLLCEKEELLLEKILQSLQQKI